MILAVISDTHGQVLTTQAACRLMESLDVEVVIHCGDIGSPEIVPLFQKWPTHFVFGNVDDNERELRQAITKSQLTCHERFGRLELAGKQIAFLHSDDARQFRDTIHSGEFDLVCYGHTHLAKQDHIGRTLVLNPGAIHRSNPHSFAIIDLPHLQVTSITV